MAANQGAATIEVTLEAAGPAYIARVVGEAGLSNVDELSRQLLKVSALHPTVIVFDMSGLTFICSLAIGSFMELYRGVKNNGGQIRFAAMTGPVETVFQKANLHHLFGSYKSTDEAWG